ncbi:MAG TPA: heparan-alpha-glucosaminide N-acetyltransferase [Bauldia sp.]|nr:heparan-alpha-glucosaminide N-acetyltransferase [Bauldia sp.]
MVSIGLPGVLRHGRRLASLDIARGLAVLAMVVYHLSWDLSAYGIVAIDVVNDPGWKTFARSIAGTFLALVGFSLVLAAEKGFRREAYLRRLAIIVVAALLVSAGTYWFMPESFVFFGILHEIALASVLALPFLYAPVVVTALASIAVLVLPGFFTSDAFDSPFLAWTGLAANPPATVDYVPVFPWFGVVLAGIVAGRLYLAYGDGFLARFSPGGFFWNLFAAMGRWSLAIYLIHQPVLIGAIYLITAFIGVSDSALGDRFVNQCAVNQRSMGMAADLAPRFCSCFYAESRQSGLAPKILSGALDTTEEAKVQNLADICIGRISEEPPAAAGAAQP